MDSEDDRRRRALQRGCWPVRRYALGDEPDEDLSQTTSAAERLDMVWQLTRDAWAAAGRVIPDYARSESPGRVVRVDG